MFHGNIDATKKSSAILPDIRTLKVDSFDKKMEDLAAGIEKLTVAMKQHTRPAALIKSYSCGMEDHHFNNHICRNFRQPTLAGANT